jgi:hypothetical protein
MINKLIYLLPIGLICLLQMQNGELSLKFDRPVMCDTLCKSQIDLVRYTVYFRFINTEKNPIIISRVRSGDPDFACRVPREPIKSNQQDSIGICLVQQQMLSNLNRSYWVEYSVIGTLNEAHSQKLQLKRVVIDCKD